jgi:hypothetical protein
VDDVAVAVASATVEGGTCCLPLLLVGHLCRLQSPIVDNVLQNLAKAKQEQGHRRQPKGHCMQPQCKLLPTISSRQWLEAKLVAGDELGSLQNVLGLA